MAEKVADELSRCAVTLEEFASQVYEADNASL